MSISVDVSVTTFMLLLSTYTVLNSRQVCLSEARAYLMSIQSELKWSIGTGLRSGMQSLHLEQCHGPRYKAYAGSFAATKLNNSSGTEISCTRAADICMSIGLYTQSVCYFSRLHRECPPIGKQNITADLFAGVAPSSRSCCTIFSFTLRVLWRVCNFNPESFGRI